MFFNFFAKLLKIIFGGTRLRKSGFSRKGFWGETRHFNKDGVQIGYTIKWLFGTRRRYDMNGKLVSYSVKNFWGGYNTYDADGNLIRRSYKNIWGGFNTYNRAGKKISESYKSFWEGFNHFDVEEPDLDEVIVPVKREYKKINSKEDSVVPKQENNVEKKPQIKHETKSETHGSEKRTRIVREKDIICEYQSKDNPIEKDKPIFTHEQNIDKSIEYYESVWECCDKCANCNDFVKILAFVYMDLKEFPAFAYARGEKIVVVPLIKESQEFEFAKSEIENAQCKTQDGLDMEIVDNEFVSLGVVSLAKEFEELFPEYLYGENGFSRTQYELACGLVVTAKSWNELMKL